MYFSFRFSDWSNLSFPVWLVYAWIMILICLRWENIWVHSLSDPTSSACVSLLKINKWTLAGITINLQEVRDKVPKMRWLHCWTTCPPESQKRNGCQLYFILNELLYNFFVFIVKLLITLLNIFYFHNHVKNEALNELTNNQHVLDYVFKLKYDIHLSSILWVFIINRRGSCSTINYYVYVIWLNSEIYNTYALK